MRLALLQARTYAPYSKWLGTAFARLGPGEPRSALASFLRAAALAAAGLEEEAEAAALDYRARRLPLLPFLERDPWVGPLFEGGAAPFTVGG